MEFTPACPMPLLRHERVLMAHGGGGRLMQQLLDAVVRPAFAGPLSETLHDSAVLQAPGSARLAFTTDSFVVRPLFFPGGDIGSLAVNGTVNDLAMAGARPLWLSCGLVLEEGFPIADLQRVVASMRAAADAAGVAIVTGDTKVVERGKGDGVYVNTAGVGAVEHGLTIGPAALRPGDRILVSGDLGRHGVAILAARESLGFETALLSDCAPLAAPVLDLLASGVEVHGLRDLTRGGLAASLVELAEASKLRLAIDEAALRVDEQVAGACEVLGLDPLHVANEGRFLVVVPAADADRALAVLRRHAVSADAVLAGEVLASREGLVVMRTRLGSSRVVDLPSGEQLPRIC
jgi:hydrogenase expression/formation protein HypE